MITTGPYSLTNGTTVTVQDPQAATGTSSAAVQVQNASPFILTVTAYGQYFTLQEFTAQTIPLTADGSPITLDPSNGPAGTQGQVEVIWLLAGEIPPMSDGQLTGAAQYAIGLGEELMGPTVPVVANPSFFVDLPPTTKTLLLSIIEQGIGPPAITNVLVIGQTTLLPYYNQRPYLSAVTVSEANFLCVIPIPAVADSQVEIIISCASGVGGPYAYSVFGDTAQYDESVFYNGRPVLASAAATGNLVTTECRLLTASVDAAGSGAAEGAITIGGVDVIRVDLASVGGATAATLEFPQPYIVQATIAAVSTGGAVCSVSYAYP